jgi:hypothetical protein
MNVSKAVLITGCSSGIGWATAERLVDVGWRVYATARNVRKIAPLEERGCELLPLDVTDEDSMRSAVDEVERREGAVGVLVNNAGYSQSGAVEAVPMELPTRPKAPEMIGLPSSSSSTPRPMRLYKAWRSSGSSRATSSRKPLRTPSISVSRMETSRASWDDALSWFRARIKLDSECPQFPILPVARAPGVLLHPPGLSLIMHVFYRIWVVYA